jgi:hypothetical protein
MVSAFRRSAGLSTRRFVIAMMALAVIACVSIGPSADIAAAEPPHEETQVEISTVSGPPAVGETLTCDLGSWSGSAPKFVFEWLRNGVVFEEGPERGTYVISHADEGTTLTCIVIATGGEPPESEEEESVNGESVPGKKQPTEPPVDVKPPTIPGSGSAKVGQTLTCESGEWSGAQPISFAYEWLRNGSKITSATEDQYQVQSADEGTTISCKVTASNSGGHTSVLSNGVEISATQLPADEIPPEVVGTPAVGQELICNPGMWSGEPTFAYEWLSNGSAIEGATARTYTVKSGDRGHSISCRVTATNHAGSVKATSVARPIVGKAPENITPPQVTGEPKVGHTLDCEVGTWAGEPTPVIRYLWVLVLGSGEKTVGNESAPYEVKAEAAGHTVFCQVFAKNSEGELVKDSPPVAVQAGSENEPKNVTPPSIEGQPEVGHVLECLIGKWTGQPTPTPTYQWVLDPGAQGETVVGEAKTYEVSKADGGQMLACTVTETNSVGTAIASSASVPIPAIAPSNTSAPVVKGRGAVGETLSCSHGSWSGAPVPGEYEYQWWRNPGVAEVGGELKKLGSETAIAKAKSSSYVVQPADEGYLLRCEVTAKNKLDETATAQSNEVAVPGSEPERGAGAAPQISGQPTVGAGLTCSEGAWTGKPQPIIEWRWLLEGVEIPKATGSVYVVTPQDASRVITCEVIARNREGVESAVSAGVTVPGNKPENTETPQISGGGRLNESLKCERGSWNAKPPPVFTYEWLRNGSTIVSATTSNTYTVQQADVGHSLTCKVIATNSDGAGEATSASLEIPGGTGNVEARIETSLPRSPGSGQSTTSTAQILAVLGSELTRAQHGARISSLLKAGHYAFAFTAPGAGTLSVFWYEVPKGAHVSSAKSKPKPVLVAWCTVSFSAGTKKTVMLRLTRAGRKLLEHSRRIKLTAKGTFTPSGGHAVTWLKAFVLSR